MWILLRETNITDLDAIADKCRKLQWLKLM